MTKQEFMDFHEALVNAEEAPLNSFEKENTLKAACLLKRGCKRGIGNHALWTDEASCLEYPDDYQGPERF